MFKDLFSLLIVFSIGSGSIAFSQTSGSAEKARQAAAKIGTGQSAKVEVKLTDKTKYKGYIDSVSQDAFSLVDEKTGTSRSISFADVDQLRKRSKGLSVGAWIGIAAAAAGAAIVIGIISIRCRNEFGSC